MVLFAKSTRSQQKLTLMRHTQDVCEAATALYGICGQPSRLGNDWLRFFQLSSARFDNFRRNLEAAAAFHDWGKANQGFQDVLDRRGEQQIRHEHLSTLLLAWPPVWNLICQSRPDIDWKIVLSAVLSHHLQATPTNWAKPMSELSKIRVLSDDDDFTMLTDEIWQRLRLPDTCPAIPFWWTFETPRPGIEDWREHRRCVSDLLDDFDDELAEDDERRKLLGAVRAALIVADGAASGLRRQGKSISDWIADHTNRLSPCEPNDVQNIIDQRQQQLESAGKWRGWSDFQLGCEAAPQRTLLLAPCGSGKTLAAWRWILARLRERPAARTIFLYPTRATATEGFRDYVAWAPEADAGLIHGTAGYELEGMFDQEPSQRDARHGKDFQDSVDPRLFALGYWSKRIFSATVDQFLAFLQYAYGPTCLLPVLADSIVVIDEVHSFDAAMFASLKTLLKEFDFPALCMTATLPPQRQRELQSCGLEIVNDRRGDLAEIANVARYNVRVADEADAREVVAQALAAGKRVLWVVNLVRRAQRFAAEFGVQRSSSGLTTEDGVPVLCYHSRFTLNDRKAWHVRVVKAFQDESQPRRGVLAVTTQVCEMSLDLDADVLVTEGAPVTSLIQRMGRCNRKTKLPLQSLGEIVVYLADDPRDRGTPYDERELTGVPEFLGQLTGGPVSQSQLEAALENIPQPLVTGDRLCQFTASGPYADGRVDPFRDIDDYSRQGVLDVEHYLEASAKDKPGLLLPVPRHLCQSPDPRLPRYLVVAPAENYCKFSGLLDEPLTSPD